MKNKIQAIYALALPGIVLAFLSVILWFREPDEISASERRKLAQFPKIGISSILDGDFMEGIESYSQDQFPFREQLRRLKSKVLFYVYHQKDINGIYVADGQAAAILDEINESSVNYAIAALNNVYEKYLKDAEHNIYMAIIPDKGFYMAAENGYPSMDYEEFFEYLKDGIPYASFIDITETLSKASYYSTDTHWRQECLHKTADIIRETMTGASKEDETSTVKLASDSFYGVYYGQSALPMSADEIFYVDSDVISGASVYNYETGRTTGVYDWDKLSGYDQYDFFLSGPSPVLLIKNPDAEKDRDLIVFRDSYAGSLLPLLIQDYKRILAIDIRYVAPSYLSELIDFEEYKKADVLYLYGTILLNDSSTMKK